MSQDLPEGVMSMTQQIEAANAPAPSEPKKKGWIDFTLPESGRRGKRMSKPTGIHMKLASAVAGGDKEAIGYALAHVTCVVEGVDDDGKPNGVFEKIALEDIYALDMADAVKLVSEAGSPLAEKPKTPAEDAKAKIEAAVTAAMALDASSESSPAST